MPLDVVEAAVPAIPAQAQATAFAVTALASQANPVGRQIVVAGRSQPSRQIDLRAEYGGWIVGPALPVGTFVGAGSAVCLLDPGTLPLRLSEAEARAVLETAEALVARGHAPEGSLHERRAAVQAAEARQAELQREDAQRRIVAPFDGVLTLILTLALLALRVHAGEGWRRLRADGERAVAV